MKRIPFCPDKIFYGCASPPTLARLIASQSSIIFLALLQQSHVYFLPPIRRQFLWYKALRILYDGIALFSSQKNAAP